ncbi:virulence RhuM family protein [Sulfurospirillum halorespirans]|uniref:Uncharacterized protein n=1 Tax=Sulfurospirillum halorespirans DSM 13726 TaxID=1193502 RepID=A0A1D7TMP8_9BACT|nr:virulence RhuM family protein [Sulfurospirillum halorespirans]AOO66250.1 hypothetical protein SHALO_2491 [Sulfurospirillum halorespirans DSM 13726]
MDKLIRNGAAEFLIFTSQSRENSIEVKVFEESVSSILEHTANDGKTYNTKYYNLDAFLEFDDRAILHDAGKITKKIADEKALSEFEKYRVVQDRLFRSDFDKLLLEVKNK